MKEYEVPINRLSADPIVMMAQLVHAAGVKACANEGCQVRWVGGHGRRRYCSPECALAAERSRRVERA